ncbi:MAG: hypothetical protein ACP5RD_07645 [bacterium]
MGIYNRIKKSYMKLKSIYSDFGLEYAFTHIISFILKKINYFELLGNYRIIDKFYNLLNDEHKLEQLKNLDQLT